MGVVWWATVCLCWVLTILYRCRRRRPWMPTYLPYYAILMFRLDLRAGTLTTARRFLERQDELTRYGNR